MQQETEGGPSTPTEAYRSPTDMFKGELVRLLFRTIEHNAKSRNSPEEKWAFFVKTRALSHLLERYTPRKAIRETREWYTQLADQIKEIRVSRDPTFTVDKKEEKILNLQYQYADEIDQQNQRIIVNSPIIDAEVEGELDVSDEDIVNVIRSGRRTDAKQLEYKC